MTEPETPTAKGSVWLRFIGGWNRWTGASVNRSIFGAALTVAAFTVAAKLVSVGKELVVAGSFGTGDALDAYLIAFLLPSFTISVVAGSFNAALIPTFIKVRDRQGPDAAQRLLSGVMFWTLELLREVDNQFLRHVSYIIDGAQSDATGSPRNCDRLRCGSTVVRCLDGFE